MGRVSRAWPVVWLAGAAAITWSVVRFELLIVVVLAACVLALGYAVLRGGELPLGERWLMPVVLVGVAVVDVWVPAFSYLHAGPHRWVQRLIAVAALGAAALWLLPRGRGRIAAVAVAALGYAGSAVAVIRGDRHPRIDVWVILQQASDGLAHGRDAYSMIWHGSPGITNAFTYWPGTLVLLAPGRWLAGDVRWALVAWTLVGISCVLALGRWRSPAARAAAVLLLLTPGQPTQVEQAWTEPLLFALIALWALLVQRGRAWWAVLPLALALASKQHIVLLLPVVAAWPEFGWRRSAATAGLAGAIGLPWYLAGPADFWHDTITLLVHFFPIPFADTLYLAAIHELGWRPPFWLTGVIVVSTVGAAVVVIRRRRPGLAEVLRWCALILFVANIVNKQAFYNQFWLVGALVLTSVAVPPVLDRNRPGPADDVTRGTTAAGTPATWS